MMKIKKTNLRKMAKFILTIPEPKFDMSRFRAKPSRKGGILFLDDSEFTHECETIGCVLGHCTALDTEKNLNQYKSAYCGFEYGAWSEEFTGIPVLSNDWDWCFSGVWVSVDNTREGASKRILYYLKNGLPRNWEEQMDGSTPLIY